MFKAVYDAGTVGYQKINGKGAVGVSGGEREMDE